MSIKSLIYKTLYWYISLVDRKKEVLFMNYGYHDNTESIELHTLDEINRYSIQLYHRLAKMVDIKDKDILEIGSGRGGGLAYLTKTFSPASALGIDLNARAVKFGNEHYKIKGLKFKQGDAQCLDLPNDCIDVILNVESSHRYQNVELFLNEVNRVLKPGGHFLFTDFRLKTEFEVLTNLLSKYNFIKFDEQFINNEVVTALKLDTARREAIVKKYAPPFLENSLNNFSGTLGSPTYINLMNGSMVYFVICFQKPF